jgi:hypothetical protein
LQIARFVGCNLESFTCAYEGQTRASAANR